MSKTTKTSNIAAILDEFFVGWAEANRHQQRAAAQRATTDQYKVKIEVVSPFRDEEAETYWMVYTEDKPLEHYLRAVPKEPTWYSSKIVVSVVHRDDSDLLKDRATFSIYDWRKHVRDSRR